MNAQLARDILSVAEEAGYLEGGMPEDEEQLVENGEYFYSEAKKAVEAGMGDSAIKRIVELGESAYPIPPGAPLTEEAGAEGLPSSQSDPGDENDYIEIEIQVPVNTSDKAPKDPAPPSRLENLPVPAPIEGEATQMPMDLTACSDREIRKLHGEYNAFYARALWVLAETTSRLASIEHLRDDAYRKVLRQVDRIDPDTGKAKLSSLIKSEVEDDKDVMRYELTLRDLESDVEKLKALATIYKGNIDRLSRDMTFRQEEFVRSGGRA